MRRLAGALALFLILFAAPVLAAGPQFPALNGQRVVDDAHVLTPAAQAALTAKLAGLEQQTTRQLVVVTLPTLGGYDIADYGYQLLRHWGIGQKATNNGALFIVVPSEHKVRIEVGYGLESVLTDALSSVILQRAVLPKFRAGDVQGGIVDGADAIVAQLSLDQSAAETRAAQAAAAPPPRQHGNLWGALAPIFFLIFIAFHLMRGRGGRMGGMGWLLPMMILGGSRGWGGGGGFGGGGGGFGGGFGGGGGSGGGGGASGGW